MGSLDLLSDWKQSIPCNDNFEVPLLCRPTFKDLTTYQKGLVLPKLPSNPSDYSNVEGAIYYNTGDDSLYWKTASSWVKIDVSGGAISYPLVHTFAADSDPIIQTTVTPDADKTYELRADGSQLWFNGSGTELGRFYYDFVNTRWIFEDTPGQTDGTIASGLFSATNAFVAQAASTIETFRTNAIGDNFARWLSTASGELRFGPGNVSPDTFLYRDSVASLTLAQSTLGQPGGQFKCGELTSAVLTVEQITTALANNNISFSVKNLTDIANITVATQISTPKITTSGTGVDFDNKNVDNVNTSNAVAFQGTNASSGSTFRSKTNGNSADSLLIYGNGEVSWGDGTAAHDMFLRRSAAQTLTISTTSGGGAGGTLAIGQIFSSALRTTSAGFGDIGSEPTPYANIYSTNGNFTAAFCKATSANNAVYEAYVDGDAQRRIRITANPAIGFSDGTVAPDVWMRRDAANSFTLSTTATGSANANLKLGTLEATTLQTRAGTNTTAFYKPPLTLYNQSMNAGTSGTDIVWRTLTFPANVSASGSYLYLRLEGYTNGAAETRNVGVTCNGSTPIQSFGLTSGLGARWFFEASFYSNGDTETRVNYQASHGSTFGSQGASLACTSLSAGLTINITQTGSAVGNVVFTKVLAVYYPSQA